MKKLFTCALLSAALSGCANSPKYSVVDFYDACAKKNPSFVAMAACGKLSRNNYCEPNNFCTADGNAFVLYSDSLAKSVENHEMSEPEAQRKWIEYRASVVNSDRQRRAAAAAAIPSAAPRTCYTSGAVTNCF